MRGTHATVRQFGIMPIASSALSPTMRSGGAGLAMKWRNSCSSPLSCGIYLSNDGTGTGNRTQITGFGDRCTIHCAMPAGNAGSFKIRRRPVESKPPPHKGSGGSQRAPRKGMSAQRLGSYFVEPGLLRTDEVGRERGCRFRHARRTPAFPRCPLCPVPTGKLRSRPTSSPPASGGGRKDNT